MSDAPITAVVITKNEGRAIQRCLDSLAFCDQVLVVDSHSTDETATLARAAGAEVLDFNWNGEYPKKKQWGMSHPSVRHNWVLHMDGDEVVTSALAQELASIARGDKGPEAVACEVRLRYHFAGRALRHGHRVRKVILLDKRRCKFPDVRDHDAPGITEVEGHYQAERDGVTVSATSELIHDDPDPLADWVSRHNKYSDWEAHLRSSPNLRGGVRRHRTLRGRLFDQVPGKSMAFFLYSYVLRLGFLDGRAGFDYAYALSFYYWLIDAKTRERDRNASPSN